MILFIIALLKRNNPLATTHKPISSRMKWGREEISIILPLKASKLIANPRAMPVKIDVLKILI